MNTLELIHQIKTTRTNHSQEVVCVDECNTMYKIVKVENYDKYGVLKVKIQWVKKGDKEV